MVTKVKKTSNKKITFPKLIEEGYIVELDKANKKIRLHDYYGYGSMDFTLDDARKIADAITKLVG